MKRMYYVALLAVFAFAGCQDKKHFLLRGEIAGLDSTEVVYLEQLTLPEVTVIDSAEVGPDGKFRFKEVRPDYPELYQLRLGDQLFIFPVDSCEQISIQTDRKHFNLPQQISGSADAVAIQELRKSAIAIQDLFNQVSAGKADKSRLEQLIQQHKERASKQIIQNPRSIVSYFALLQKVSGYYIFSPFNRDDRKYCAAVATSFHTFMPDYYRSRNLYNFVMAAIKQERMERNDNQIQQLIDQADAGFLDIDLPDVNEQNQQLSALRGQVVLIDFCAFEDPASTEWMFDLRDLYQKYHAQGFNIYQVSFDREKLIWQRSAINIPWPCVYDAEGASARLYNVTEVPTYFIMTRTGEVVRRLESLSTAEAEIKKWL